MNKIVPFATLLLVAALMASCAKKAEDSGTAANSPPATSAAAPHAHAKLLKSWVAGLTNRRPGRGAGHSNQLGRGGMIVALKDSVTSWSEQIDVDGNGTLETVGFLWDDQNKVMFAYTKDAVALDDSTMMQEGLMIAQFGAGNSRGRPEGSGWYAYAVRAVSTDGGQAAGDLFGCRYDQNGNETECGSATWQREGNELAITTQPS